MSNSPTSLTQHSVGNSTQRTTLICIGFFALGFLCFWSGAATLFRYPEILFGEPYRPEVLSVAHLLVLGWLSSMIFGAGYMILPVMATTRLWSTRLAWWHLVLHVIGVPWMVLGFIWMDFAEVGHGGSAVFIGIILVVINLMKTASRFNRWDPAVITFLFAFFWLLINSSLAIVMLVNKYIPMTEMNPQNMIGIHAHLGLVGFLWMVLLGASLKLLPLLTASPRRPGWFAWLGCIVLNLGLLLLLIVGFYDYYQYQQTVVWLFLVGTLLYFADVARVLFAAQRKLDWGVITVICGLLFGVLLLIWVLVGSPVWGVARAETLREQMRIYFSLALLGPFALAVFGMGTRIIPYLVWHLKYAHLGNRTDLPEVQDLARKSGLLPMWISLVAGWIYLAMGQLTGELGGVQIGMMLILIGTGWFFYTLVPALQTMLAGSSETESRQLRDPVE